MDLLRIISSTLKSDVLCFAFGGTAMMFYGFKDETKDVDLLFETPSGRTAFIEALKLSGFEEYSPMKVYTPEKLRDKNRPLIYKREDYRFDLFLGKIFRTSLSPNMKENLFAVHEFKEKKQLIVKVLSAEHIVQLKAITERKTDFEDIRTIVEKSRSFNWQYLIDEVVWQHNHGDSWALLDTEKMLKELKKYVFIEKKYFDQLYKAQKFLR